MSSIEMMNLVNDLQQRVAALEEIVKRLVADKNEAAGMGRKTLSLPKAKSS